MKAIPLFLVAIFLIANTVNTFGQEVPTTWQPGMKVESHYGGGMRDYSYEISITDGESYLITKGENARTVKKKFSTQQLNELLIFLREHNFDKLEGVHTGPTDDKASEGFILSWDDHVVGASEGPAIDIPADQEDDFNAIQAHLMSLFGQR